MNMWLCILVGLGLVTAADARGLEVGAAAPDFSAASTGGGTVKLSDFKGKWVVLYFYPKAFTPGCTKETCSLRDGHAELAGLDAVVLGVSLDGLEKQKEFKAKYEAPFELIADSDKKVSEAYGVLAPMRLFAERRTFIISPEGKIAHIFEKVDVANHAAEVKAVLLKLRAK